MRTVFLGWIGLLVTYFVSAQEVCRSFEYQQLLLQKDPALQTLHDAAQNFVKVHESSRLSASPNVKTIIIPVVVHVIYHFPGENISDSLVGRQICALNRDFRKLNADTVKIPES